MKLRATLISIAMLFGATAAQAGDSEITGHANITSNWLVNGLSWSGEAPAVQGGMKYMHKGLGVFGGLWHSHASVSSAITGQTGNSANWNANPIVDVTKAYVGYHRMFGDLGLKIKGKYWGFTRANANFVEYGLNLSYKYFDLGYWMSGSYLGTDQDLAYLNFRANYDIKEDINIAFHYGMSSFSDENKQGLPRENYNDWSLAVKKTMGSNALTLGHSWTDRTDLETGTNKEISSGDNRWFASVSHKF